ncbi:MAG: ATP-binding protein [Bacteroidales bacterium]|nr:ATP-binding protein [Bacteroidales bacterium]
MLKRKIDSYLDDFYKKTSKALLVTGARQTGKSFSIRQFGKTHFRHFVEINFIEMKGAAKALSEAKNTKDMLLRISAITNQSLVEGQTLIFFDEVQECPEIVTNIKFLVDDGRYRYIMSGSLLGVELKDLRSEPVGYMDIKEMYPLDIEEFFTAVGVSDIVWENVRKAWGDKHPVDSFVHSKLMELFHLYLVVGGMPAVVQKYVETNNLKTVLAEQKAITLLYKRDIAKYDPQNKLYLNEIFELIPVELNSKNKRFILKKLNENMKFSRYENSFIWLKEAGVVLPVFNVESPTIPLKLSRSRNLFKLFQNDVGLLASQYSDEDIQLRLLSNDKNINFGAVYENAVAQELHAHGLDLYYFNNKKQGELDFVAEINGKVVPIEVKSGKDYQRHNALSNVLNNKEYNIQQAYVFSNDNVSQLGDVLYFPIYMATFLNSHKKINPIYKIDMSGLTDTKYDH